MADIAESSSIPSVNDKPVIVRVKRKAHQSPLEALWLEIKERPLKRPLLDFEKLSISDSSGNVEGLKTRKVFVQHLETISSSEATVDILQSFVPKPINGLENKGKNEERRRTLKTESKQDQLLVKAKQNQEVLSKNARFEQIWRRRKGKKETMNDEALHDMCHVYDVVRVDIGETTDQVHERDDADLEDHRIMCSYLPLLREVIPSAAAEVESNIHDYMSKQASTDDYVYDLYAANNDFDATQEDASNVFPLVQVNDDDEFYDGPIESDYETDDSNAEDNPLNDYPDEETSDEEEDRESRTSNDESEEHDSTSASNNSSKPEEAEQGNSSDNADPMCDDDYIYGDGDSDGDAFCYDGNDGDNDDDWRWSYR